MSRSYDFDYARAARAQARGRTRVRRDGFPRRVRTVGGCDVGVDPATGRLRAAVVVLGWPGLTPVEVAVADATPSLPYVPGFLSFREMPAIVRAWRRLRVKPDLLLIDGQGWAHPRRFGLACHAGVVLDVAAIGCGKSRLVGEHRPVGAARGSWAALQDGGETIGVVLRTRAGVKPIYVSVGHRIDLGRARRWALACATRFRLPEPIRAAHRAGILR